MLVFPSTGESKAPGCKKRVALSALFLHLTGLVSQYHLFIENTRDILRACGVSTVTSLISQKGPFAVCAASSMCSREPWVSEASALPLRHSDPTPQGQADLVFARACNHWSHSHQPQQMEFFRAAAHEHSNFTHTGFGARSEVLNQYTRDLQHKP